MENLKIKVNSEAESKEAQELFFELGYEMGACSIGCYPVVIITTKAWGTENWCSTRAIRLNHPAHESHKEITLPELRDMVVLRRNPMKEYLDPNQNYKLVLCAEKDKEEGFIEVPEGADYYAKDSNNGFKGEFFFRLRSDSFDYEAIWLESNWMRAAFNVENQEVLWQRHTQPEELPFVDDEPIKRMKAQDEVISIPKSELDKFGFSVSLNDQYAEIEKVRQSKIDETLAERQAQYGCFEDVAFVTESIMGILSKVRGNGLQDLPHPHRMALYMIASKMARIVNGDFNHLDSWHDIGGYAKLIEKLIDGE